MELAGFEVGVVLEFHHFHELAIGRRACNLKAGLLEFLAEFAVVVELVAVTVTLANLFALVEFRGVGILREFARVEIFLIKFIS